MYEFLKEYTWAFALGVVLAASGWNYRTWQFWILGAVIILLVAWSKM